MTDEDYDKVAVNMKLAEILQLFEIDTVHFDEHYKLLKFLRFEVRVIEQAEQLSPLEELYEMYVMLRALSCK